MMSLSISMGGGWRPAPATRASRCARNLPARPSREGGEWERERRDRRGERGMLLLLRAAGHEAWSPREAGKSRASGLLRHPRPLTVGSQLPRWGRTSVWWRRAGGSGGHLGNVRAPAAGGRWEPSEFLHPQCPVYLGGS